MKRESRYHRVIARDADGLSDVYDVLRAFGITDPAHAHALKKGLVPGGRNGGKSAVQDLQEAIWSLEKYVEHLKATQGGEG